MCSEGHTSRRYHYNYVTRSEKPITCYYFTYRYIDTIVKCAFHCTLWCSLIRDSPNSSRVTHIKVPAPFAAKVIEIFSVYYVRSHPTSSILILKVWALVTCSVNVSTHYFHEWIEISHVGLAGALLLLRKAFQSGKTCVWASHGMSRSGNEYGPLTDLPDWSYTNGRPAPMNKGQRRRQRSQKFINARVKRLLREVDEAKASHRMCTEEGVEGPVLPLSRNEPCS